MRLDSKLFKSKLAWRFFGLFIVCAFVPILAMALMAHTHVAGQLETQAYERLRGYAKSHGMSIIEHLILAEGQLKLLEPALTGGTGIGVPHDYAPWEGDSGSRHFSRLGIYSQGRYRALLGASISADTISDAIEGLEAEEGTTLLVLPTEEASPEIALVRRVASQPAEAGGPNFLVGVLNPGFLWGMDSGTILPSAIQWSVWDHRQTNLFSTLPQDEQAPIVSLVAMDSGGHAGNAALTLPSDDYLAGYWSMFIKPQFHTPRWFVVVMEPRSKVMAPFYRFQNFFPLVVLITLGIVLLLSSVAIRKSLVPIDSLLQGARQVAQGRFIHRVEVASRDEFHDLAQAFNRMSGQLDKQFKTQSARSDVDRAILSLLDAEAIVFKILPSLNLFFPCVAGAITLLDEKNPAQGHIYSEGSNGLAPRVRKCHISSDAQALLSDHPNWMEIADASSPLSFLWEVEAGGAAMWIVLPVYHHKRPIALVCFACVDRNEFTVEDLEHADQLTHQLAVALSNAALISELKNLNMGTLNALARTVDAKSPWTAGHSERVMQMSLQLGKTMGLSTDQLDDIHSAALLHDIGKIGIPVSILDKKDPLTDDEFDKIRTHPSLGARILDPIASYRRLIPIVEQHHERYDGKGYPKRLAGEAIHVSARIMAVADAYDAMVSDRPYRRGMPLQKVRRIIREESGRQFDPEVVKAFELVVARKFPLSIVAGGNSSAAPVSMTPKAAQAR